MTFKSSSNYIKQSAALVLCVIAAWVCSAPPIIFLTPTNETTRCYLSKSENPLADTTNLPPLPYLDQKGARGEVVHCHNINPRIVGGAAIWLSKLLHLPLMAPAFLGGILVLFSAICVGYCSFKDTQASLLSGLLLSGLFVSTSCFSWQAWGKPFDGVALGFIALAVITMRIFPLLCITTFLACWTDERAILSLFLLPFISLALHGQKHFYRVFTAISSSVLSYIITFLLIKHMLAWPHTNTTLVGASALQYTIPWILIMPWLAFEGGIALLILVALNWRGATLLHLLLALTFSSLATQGAVLDLSRTSSFSFTIMLTTVGIVAKFEDKSLSKSILFASVFVSLLCPNIEIVADLNQSVWVPLDKILGW